MHEGLAAMELTEHAQKLLDAIRAAQASTGGYVDRKDIAAQLGRAVHGADIAVLDLLAANGVIESVEQETRAPSGIKLLYRVQG